MNSRPTIVFVLLLCLNAIAFAQTKPIAINGEGTANDFWVAETTVDANGTPMTSVRQRTDATSGKWTEIARLQDRVQAIAAAGNRLAIALPDSWRLLWDGGGFLGPPLPEDRVISRLAGDGDALWALAGPAAGQTPELFRWDEAHSWVKRGTLPPEAGSGAGSLAVRDGVPWIAYLTTKNVCVDRAEATGWKRIATLPMTPSFKLLTGGPLPLLAWCDAAGKWTIYDLSADPPKPIRSAPTTGPSDVAISGTSLRVLAFNKDDLIQQGFDDFGRGAAFGPDPIARVIANLNQATEWPNFFLMGVLTAALVVGLRSRGLPTADTLAAAHVRVAPPIRRFGAGLIDSSPYFLSYFYVAEKFESSTVGVVDAPMDIYLPILIGLAIYVIHVAISEYFFKRSIGKYLFGLRVVAADGTPALPGPIVLRNLMRVLDMSLGLPFVFLMIYFTGQRFGDMAAKTLVVVDAPDEKAV